MIVGFQELQRLRGAVAMVDGCFDPLHPGHIEYFRAATELGPPVLCNVTGDVYLRNKHVPLLPGPDRAAVIDAIRYVSYTHLSEVGTEQVLAELRPRYYVKGEDWRGRIPAAQLETCSLYGTEVVYLATVRDSSTRILRRFFEQAGEWR